jgi:hypothetical protein
LAEDFGWRPLGTKPPPDWDAEHEVIGEWPGDYTTNDGQLVTAQDASALGAALQAALASGDFERRIRDLHRGAEEQIQSPGCTVTLPVDVSDCRKSIEDFVGFCTKGGFRIY